MATGNTTSSNLIIPELWVDAIAGAIGGMSVFGKTGACRVETGLPGGVKGGDTVNVPMFGSLGTMGDYADGEAIAVSQLTMTNEQATVVRSGIAFNITDMARRLAGYADPYAEGGRQFAAALEQRANQAMVTAANATGLPTGMVLDQYSSSAPVRLDRDLLIEAKMRWGDEQDGVAAITGHSAVLKSMLKLKDGQGQPLLRVIRQDMNTGVVEFEGLPPFYTSDLNPVEFPITAAGTTPPTVTVDGRALGDYNLRIEITTLGSRGTSLFRWSIDGGTTWEATGVATAADVELGDTGLTAHFAVGTSATDNVYTCSEPKYSTLLVKQGALVFWTDPPNAEDFRDPLRKATISATDILHVAHRYKRMPGRRKPGVVRIVHNR
jgi:hypothetical protein